MTDLTPETIEAIPNEAVVDIKNLAVELHEATVGILSTPMSSADIDGEVRLRTAMKLKLDDAMGFLKSQVADLEAILRDLRTKKGYLSSDEDRLKSYFFSTLREEKSLAQ